MESANASRTAASSESKPGKSVYLEDSQQEQRPQVFLLKAHWRVVSMRKAQDSDIPTDAELSILHVLWQRGPSTVREVFEAIAPDGRIGYTAVLKLMQIMAAKGLVSRDDSERA